MSDIFTHTEKEYRDTTKTKQTLKRFCTVKAIIYSKSFYVHRGTTEY